MASRDSSSSSTDWTWLSNVVLDLILDKLILFSDQVRFAAVCKPWRSVALHKKQQTRKEAWYKQPPMLLVPNGDGNGRLYSISEEKLYNCCLPVPYSKKSCGSSMGWLAKAEDDMAITLTNPFSGNTICLPPITKVPHHQVEEDEDDHYDYDYDYSITPSDEECSDQYENVFVPEFYVQRIILSDDPSLHPNNYMVAAIYGDIPRLAFIKSGDESWTYLDENLYPSMDVYFYKGQLYALDAYNALIKVNVDINGNTSKSPSYEIVVPARSLGMSRKAYLVEASNGDLLLVRRFHFLDENNWERYDMTVNFKVYRLTMTPMNMMQYYSGEGEKGEWVEINSLVDDAVFVGDSHTMCVLASDFPSCQTNSIYYTDDCYDCSLLYKPSASDTGVFNLEEQRFGKHYNLDSSHKCYAPPVVWIMPLFH